MLVSTVTPKITGFSLPRSAAVFLADSAAFFIISLPPDVWILKKEAPFFIMFSEAFDTVFGISWSFTSKKNLIFCSFINLKISLPQLV